MSYSPSLSLSLSLRLIDFLSTGYGLARGLLPSKALAACRMKFPSVGYFGRHVETREERFDDSDEGSSPMATMLLKVTIKLGVFILLSSTASLGTSLRVPGLLSCMIVGCIRFT